MAKHNVTLTDDQEAALQYGFDTGGTEAPDLDAYAGEWLGSVLSQFAATLPEQRAEAVKAAYLADPDTAAALDAAIIATPVKAKSAPAEILA